MQTDISSLQNECHIDIKERQQFKYEILDKTQLIQKEQCNSLAFDDSSTFIIASFGNILKAYLFNSKSLIPITLVLITRSTVTCIEALSKCNLFVFAKHDGQLQLSSKIGFNQGKYMQKLQYHVIPIYHLKSSKNSESIISCDDWKVSISIRTILLQYVYTYINNYRICDVSLNEIGDKLIIADYGMSIKTFIKRGTEWIQLMKIKLAERGQGISFIGNDSFVVQQKFKTLDFYKIVNDNLIKQRELQIQSYGNYSSKKFNQKYIKEKQILLNKDGTSLNFIKIQDDPYFVIEFSLTFYDSSAQVALSEDGSYLVSWDNFTKSLNMYKYYD